MPGGRTSTARDAPQTQTNRKQDGEYRSARARKSPLSPAQALQTLRSGGQLSPAQAAALSHTVGNKALEELLAASRGPERNLRPLPTGEIDTPPLSIPGGLPEPATVSEAPAWGGTDGGESG